LFAVAISLFIAIVIIDKIRILLTTIKTPDDTKIGITLTFGAGDL